MKKSKYSESESLLNRSEKVIPLGSQTFSKSKTQLPYGISPYFATHAEGAYFWDVDGNRYVDFVNSLAAITIGYNDPEINQAVIDQLKKGTIFSLSTELEIEVAERICQMVPCAEYVRFGKNGSDATAGAIRVARAYTGKDHVFVCGYHGWQDWYIGTTTRDLGVPKATRNLSHSFVYNDIKSLQYLFKKYKGDVAAVILEPMNVEFPRDRFLEKVKEITHANNALLIFDEIVTGFRFSKGGAQEYFDVIPDLATFGKGLANGFPLSAVVGKKDYMKLMEEVFFSFTFGGETLSLVAAKVVLEKLIRNPVIENLWEKGRFLKDRLEALINEFGFSEFLRVNGAPVWSFFSVKETDWASALEIKTLLLQEMFENGIYTIGTHNLSYAHTSEDIDNLINAYRFFFENLRKGKRLNSIRSLLKSPIIEPLFKIR